MTSDTYYGLRLDIERIIDEESDTHTFYGWFLPPEKNPHRQDMPLIVAIASTPERLRAHSLHIRRYEFGHSHMLPEGFPESVETEATAVKDVEGKLLTRHGKAIFRYHPLTDKETLSLT